jgi:arsenite-transporting ATPase
MEGLEEVADMIFGDEDPAQVYAKKSPMRFASEGGIDKLYLKMPFLKKDEIELFRGGNNALIIKAGEQKRTISLPLTLVDAEILGAEFDDEDLVIKFKRPR